MPTALLIVCPRSVLICPLFSPCAPGSSKSCKDCPVGSNNAGLQWRPVLQLPMGQSRSLQTAGNPGAHGIEQGQSKLEQMNRGQANLTGARTDEGSGHGMAKVAGKHSLLNKAAAGERSRRTIRPVQALKQNSRRRSGRYRPHSKTTASRRHWSASRRAVHVVGGSAVVLATQEAGSDLPTCLSPSHLSPLPVTVHTHSLNLKNPI